MAKESGWWTFSTTVEPNESDLEHIATMIRQGFTSGEICENEAEDVIKHDGDDTYSG